MLGNLFTPLHLIIMLIIMVLVIVPYWHIFRKAGFAPALSLLMMIPMANLIMLYVLAFSEWKVGPSSVPPR